MVELCDVGCVTTIALGGTLVQSHKFGAVDRIRCPGAVVAFSQIVLKKKIVEEPWTIAMERPVVMPETYDGTGDWPTYLQYFENCGELNGWDAARQAQVLGVRLRGAAQAFHATLAQPTRQAWDLVTAALTGRFVQPQQTTLHKSAFKNRRRRSEEQLPEFADDLRRLATRAYPTAAEELRDELARDQFIEGLGHSAMQMKLKEANLATLDLVLAQALHLETLWAGTSSTARMGPETATAVVVGAVSKSQGTQDPIASPAASGLAERVTKLESVAADLATATAQLQKTLSEFSLRTAGAPPPSRRFQPQYRPTWRPRTCFACGEEGHFAANCPHREGPSPAHLNFH